ncbi:hypothetical protein GCAAIG_02675 [Candidatus Electronema halotolerans]
MKDIDSFLRSQYLRIFLWMLYPSIFLGIAYLYWFGSFKLILIMIPINFILPLPIMLVINWTANFFVSMYSGGGRSATLTEQLAGELNKCRYLKSEKRFAEALQTADFILEQMPEHAEALLLKAQILHEGFADLRGAKQCLRQIMRLELPPESTTRQWAKGMLEEVNLRLQENKEQESS